MHLCVRADASTQIGMGHIMRCFALADELRIRGVEVSFVCREHAGHLIELIEQEEYPVERLHNPDMEYGATFEDIACAAWLGISWEQDAAETIAALGKAEPDWLIIDHYSIDSRWEDELRSHAGRIMVIDDLADRPH
ncbi:MAG: UDP-2,4-diacetamido-2,4,6-trideoxy-beta-L-altropyranose hydrolase, partial [Syntrophales bacterium LBB04]|nr:UDP-2,4-diacetamido-2,4,6-trideoxy-beta-L-altropyranose hydrolase [Syntrophales bacterium LBB04]